LQRKEGRGGGGREGKWMDGWMDGCGWRDE
jgi:hypothetical protein